MNTGTLNLIPTAVQDRCGRPLGALRISVTDRCNFRCRYCMPRERYAAGHRFLAGGELLSVSEISRLAGVFVAMGVDRIRITGGEPLLRPDVDGIVAALAGLPLQRLGLSTNGALLGRWAGRLHDVGLNSVNISLDSLDPAVFAAMSASKVPLDAVLGGIAAARAAGIAAVKLNCVVRRGTNDTGILELVELARRDGLTVRFIEYMDVGGSSGWRLDEVVTAQEILERITQVHPAEECAQAPGEVARRYRFLDGGGEFGLITSVSRPFCGGCIRARLSADGRLYTCLFAGAAGLDLRELLRAGAYDEALDRAIAECWQARGDRYSDTRSALTASADRVAMSYIGG